MDKVMYQDKLSNAATPYGAELRRNSPIEDSIDNLKVSVGAVEDLAVNFNGRLAPILCPSIGAAANLPKTPSTGVPIADTLDQLSARLNAVIVQLRDTYDRLGV